ncbi:MAG: AAA family ATPase, partial [Planctomycetes bacterium]|nr:AAA family ATPase [Planctomycetota bacterium]
MTDERPEEEILDGEPLSADPTAMDAEPEALDSPARDRILALRAEVQKVLLGQDEVLDQVLLCLLAEGHV